MPFMDKAFGSLTAIPPTRKAAARAAFVDVKESARAVLAECFKQFGIDSVVMSGHAADRLAKEKFEACVVKLSPAAEKVMEAARSSPSGTSRTAPTTSTTTRSRRSCTAPRARRSRR